jgi:hypothetical protein
VYFRTIDGDFRDVIPAFEADIFIGLERLPGSLLCHKLNTLITKTSSRCVCSEFCVIAKIANETLIYTFEAAI